jgi:protein involved in polysaccharide export with SLBB domain
MKKIKILILLLLVFQVTYAQVNEKRAGGSKEASSENLSRKITDASGMSDDEIIEYISKQAEKGVPGRDIVLYLLKKGVSEERLNAIRDLLNEEKNAKKSKKMNESVKEDRMRESGELTTGSMIVKKEVEEVIPDSAEISELTGELDKKIEIFGHNLFNKKELSFEPNLSIATPDNYKLGPGDEVIIDVWGASQSTFRDYISPDGYINIDKIGLIYLSGMTIKNANEYLRDQYSEIFSGLSDDEQNADIKITLGQIRSIQIRVMGEVENPGTYTVPSLASLFHAIYLAGGVNEIGSLRNIKVARNGKDVAVLDVYEYLLKGKTSGDVRLYDGDVIIIPAYDKLVNATGMVKRPMYYEMKGNETAHDLVTYAGGYARKAFKGCLSIERYGDNGMQFFTLDAAAQKNFVLRDGDVMIVDSINDLYENLVEVKGAVYRPGKFQLGFVNTVKDIITASGDLRPDAYTSRALLNRRMPDMSMENLTIDLEGIMNGTSPDVKLRNYDVLYIPSTQDVEEVKYFNIYGEVAFPGKYRFAHNTSVEDAILMAGGLTDKASTSRVEVVRHHFDSSALQPNDTVASTYVFNVDKNLKLIGNEDFKLMPFDAVYVRRSPTFVTQRNVVVEGEVAFAGTYVLGKKNMRLSELVQNAGGVTADAYIEGARLERKLSVEERERLEKLIKTVQRQMDSTFVANIEVPEVQSVGIRLENALSNPGGDDDIVLQDGDRLVIPEYVNTVTISGNVMYPNTVTYKEGENLKYYIDQAGGYGLNAKKSKAIIVYKNGTVARAKNRASLIKPGCEIIIPNKVKREGLSTAEIFSLSSTSASLATVIISLINLISK